MRSFGVLAAVAAGLSFSTCHAAEGIYPPSSAVVQISGEEEYRKLLLQDHASIIEFYAPWCGHCKNLKPHYENLAKSVFGIANVAAVNCEDVNNKPVCAEAGVTGFPTLKMVRPRVGKARGKPGSMDLYPGARTVKAMSDQLLSIIPDHVTKVKNSAQLGDWIKTVQSKDDTEDSGDNSSSQREPIKVLLIKDEISIVKPLFRALAIDFLDQASFAQTSLKDAKAILANSKDPIVAPSVRVFGIGLSSDGVVYGGDIEKAAIKKFVSEYAPVKPAKRDNYGKKQKAKNVKKDTTGRKAKASSASKPEPSSSSETNSENDSSTGGSTTDSTSEDNNGSSSSSSTPDVPQTFRETCLSPTSRICIALVLPGSDKAFAELMIPSHPLLRVLSDLNSGNHKNIPPIFILPSTMPEHQRIRQALALKDDTNSAAFLIAINNKMHWWRHFVGVSARDAGKAAVAPVSDDADRHSEEEGTIIAGPALDRLVQDWLEDMRLGEGKKMKLPSDFIQVMIPDDDVAAPLLADNPSSSTSTSAVEEPSSESAQTGEENSAATASAVRDEL